MSLQLVANHLAQKGRGPDSTLVHMSDREVAGLQALAQKHGGELSVNPDTGLPEAGFLDSILPAVAGAGLAYFGVNPMMAAGIVGGISALDSKDLSKGLMAGLGAYGGAGMVGGLAGLGAAGTAEYGPTLAGASDAARTAAVDQAIANGTYQSAVGAGASNFANAPMASLSALGGGSAIKGSLPILAGLAPAAADIGNMAEEDEIPDQPKGYIRKYAFDPVTGQYKQVGAYEAGGDPNKDMSSEAGTAGAFGGVPEPTYQQPKGMAAGGTASDSERVYDYLMGRGPNPMQFTHQQEVQPTPAPEPITPTTKILDKPFDEYGNIQKTGGGGYSPEQREAFMNETMHDYGDGTMTRNDYWGLDAGKRAELDAKFAQEHPYKNALAEGIKTFVMPGSIASKIYGTAQTMFGKPVDVTSDPFQYYAHTEFGSAPDLKNPYGSENFPAARITAAPEGTVGSPTPQGDPQQRAQQAQADREASAQASLAPGAGSGGGGGNRDGGIGGSNPGDPGRGGGGAHLAQGGIANLHQYNLGSYSDGGRLLKGPGDGVSDDIPATIGHGQPARLADGEFVIPARIVSEIGNGSTDAGARELYKMMDRIQAGRKKTVGKDQVAKNSKAARHLPA